MHQRRAKEPFPDPYYQPPQWPPLMVHPLDQYGLPDYDKPSFKPKIQPWMLNNVRRAAPSMGKIVGKSKAVLWMLNPDREYYYAIRAAKTKAYAARRVKGDKAERRRLKRYGNSLCDRFHLQEATNVGKSGAAQAVQKAA
jgi:hypothetical protein